MKRKLLCLMLSVLLAVVPVIMKDDLAAANTTNEINPKAGDIYVSAEGSASGAGTVDSPKDLVTAISQIKAGNTIWMLPGTYKFSQSIKIDLSNSGTSSAYKAISSIDGGKVVIDFSQMSDSDSNRGIVLNGKYWHVYGIEITGAGDNGMLLSGDYNIIEMCQFYGNRDSGLQLSRSGSNDDWPAYNYILNCTAYNNMDSTGEDADGFAAKLTCGEGNVFDGCMSYNNCDDGWDLYAKSATGPIGVVTIKSCIAFRNGKLTTGEGTSDGDMNGFKLGGSGVGTPHIIMNCIAFENGAHGFTDNNNPTAITLAGCTSFNNSVYTSGNKANFTMSREKGGVNSDLLSFATHKVASDGFVGTIANSVYYNNKPAYYHVTSETSIDGKEKLGTIVTVSEADFVSLSAPDTSTDFHTYWRNADGSINTRGFLQVSEDSFLATLASDGGSLGARINEGALDVPTDVPTEEPTDVPTEEPTAVPTEEPTAVPTEEPTAVPTEEPTAVPTEEPTTVPTEIPTPEPTEIPETEKPSNTEGTITVTYILGDVNEDGRVNAEDALCVLKHSAKLETINKPIGLLAADADEDGTVDAKDALWILKKAAGII